MLDFMIVTGRKTKNGIIEIYPIFKVRTSEDLMIRGGDFYAIWNEKDHIWSTVEDAALQLIDDELDIFKKNVLDYVEKVKSHAILFNDVPSEYKNVVELILSNQDSIIKVLHTWNGDSGQVDKWHKYVQKQMRDNFHPLDEKLIFSNTDVAKEDYSSKRLPYPLEKCDIPAYNEIISTLYSNEEREKIEWAIGAIVSGDSKKIQKFAVMYGPPGSGKSTILNIIQDLFEGYFCVFDAKALGSSNNAFALEAFKTNPLVAIQHDGDLSRIEDNTRLNSLVSHEYMSVNEKYRSAYANRFNTFLFMGTNKPVKITDSKSGIIRRLIDITPSGKKISPISKYRELVGKTKFELGGIALHCLEVYKENPGLYDDYIPTAMLGASNDFYNYILDSYEVFKRDDSATLKSAWEMYKTYNDEAKVLYPYNQRVFKEELKSYFKNFQERTELVDGTRVRNYYSGFLSEKFEYSIPTQEKREAIKNENNEKELELNCTESLFDDYCSECKAQYATSDGVPRKKWENVTTRLKDILSSQLHYVKVPENHIVIDFDLKDEFGNKCYRLNAIEAAKWPPTYAEVSQGGNGIHLHYIYTGDPNTLSRIYSENIEIKVFSGGSSLRRKLTRCNDLEIANISTGLPLKEENKVINFEGLANEKALRTTIINNMNKLYAPGTKPSIDFIYNSLEDCYNKGMVYDVSDMKPALITFAGRSSHHADYCMRKVLNMKLKSEAQLACFDGLDSDTIIFFDVEVFPNLFVIVWKAPGKKCVKMINPTSRDVENLLKFRLIGFNNRRYDCHILYGRLIGETNEQLFIRSKNIIDNRKEYLFGNAYNLSYTDVYDFTTKKQSLKKYEIDLGIHHQELDIPWDKPVPEELWDTVAEYCANDVEATEATFNSRKEDFVARQILAEITGLTVNNSTNSLTANMIVGSNKHPQDAFRYRNLALPVTELDDEMKDFLTANFPEMMSEPHICDGEHKSLLPYFPGYTYDRSTKTSTYKGVVVGEGGRVWANPGMYSNVITFDVASMHPHSIISEYLFGPYTKNYNDLKNTRIEIKHKNFDKLKTMFNGKLEKFVKDPAQAKGLATALKIAINSCYGETAASFDNPLRDPRNIDNIVAKRGALFMVDLQEEVEKRGGKVIHIKTDSIKVVDPSPELQDFIISFGKKYGYTFEIEHKFEKICLVNNAVYIALLSKDDEDWISDCKDAEEKGKPKPTRWTATGAEFQQSYVFKKLFSKEPIIFSDLCETKEVKTSMYLDINEGLPDVSAYEKRLTALSKEYDKANNKKGKDSGQLYSLPSTPGTISDERDDLISKISEGHNYRYVGKVGQFCPIKSGCGAGLLVRSNNNKFGYDSVTGAKDYRWLESEIVKELHKEDDIDYSYYNKLVDDAISDISKFGDFEWFVSED